jgi:hypothetical protein
LNRVVFFTGGPFNKNDGSGAIPHLE